MRRIAILALALLGAASLAASASAGQAFGETFHAEGTRSLQNYCDVEGLDVRVEFVMDGRVHIVPHGPDQLGYFLQHGRLTEVITNPATGKSVTIVSNVIEKDKLVTDNGDGTLTALVLATGNAVLYGADGKAIARNPGQVRFELLVDDTGVLDFLGIVKESTGRSDDFCAAAVPALS